VRLPSNVAIASRLVSTNAPVRLKVIDSGTALGPPSLFDSKADLAVVRVCRRLVEAQAIVIVSHMAALIIAPPGSSIDSMEKTKKATAWACSEAKPTPRLSTC